MGRVLLTPRSEPAVDWSEIESRLQEISAPARPSDLAAEPLLSIEASLPVEPSATLANDPTLDIDLPQTTDICRRPLPGDPLEMLSSPSEDVVSLLPHQDIITEFQAADRGFRSIE